jgi:hypothetical protein
MFEDNTEASLKSLKERLQRFRSSTSSIFLLDEDEEKREREEAEKKEKEFSKIAALFITLDKDRKHFKWVVRHLETLGLKPKIGRVVRGFLDGRGEKLSKLSGWWRYLYDHGFRRAKISKVFYNAKEELQAYSIGRKKTGSEDLVYVAHYCNHKSCAKIIKARSLEASKQGTTGPGAYITSTFLPDKALHQKTIADHIFSNPAKRLKKGDVDCAIMFKIPKSHIRVQEGAGMPVEKLGNSADSHIKIGVAKDPDEEYVKIKLETSIKGMRMMIANMELVTEALKKDLQKMEEQDAKKRKAKKAKEKKKSGTDFYNGTEL